MLGKLLRHTPTPGEYPYRPGRPPPSRIAKQILYGIGCLDVKRLLSGCAGPEAWSAALAAELLERLRRPGHPEWLAGVLETH